MDANLLHTGFIFSRFSADRLFCAVQRSKRFSAGATNDTLLHHFVSLATVKYFPFSFRFGSTCIFAQWWLQADTLPCTEMQMEQIGQIFINRSVKAGQGACAPWRRVASCSEMSTWFLRRHHSGKFLSFCLLFAIKSVPYRTVCQYVLYWKTIIIFSFARVSCFDNQVSFSFRHIATCQYWNSFCKGTNKYANHTSIIQKHLSINFRPTIKDVNQQVT